MMTILPTMMMSTMIIAVVMIMFLKAMIYAVRLAGCFAILLAFMPVTFWRSLTKPAKELTKRSYVLTDARGFERPQVQIKGYLPLKSLQGDARFKAFLRKMNLPD
jgi:hypothetical protein